VLPEPAAAAVTKLHISGNGAALVGHHPQITVESLWGSKTLWAWEMIRKTIASALLALTVLTGFAAGALAYNPDAHNAKQFFEQQEREAR
jgi:hypothetical protein